MKDGELYARAIDEDGDDLEFMLYPIGENEFGVKRWYSVVFKFEEGTISYGGYTCKKL